MSCLTGDLLPTRRLMKMALGPMGKMFLHPRTSPKEASPPSAARRGSDRLATLYLHKAAKGGRLSGPPHPFLLYQDTKRQSPPETAGPESLERDSGTTMHLYHLSVTHMAPEEPKETLAFRQSQYQPLLFHHPSLLPGPATHTHQMETDTHQTLVIVPGWPPPLP